MLSRRASRLGSRLDSRRRRSWFGWLLCTRQPRDLSGPGGLTVVVVRGSWFVPGQRNRAAVTSCRRGRDCAMNPGSTPWAGAVLVGLAAAVLLSGCTSTPDATGGRASSVTPVATGVSPSSTTVRPKSPSAGSSSAAPESAVGTVPPPCRTQGSAFELSVVAGFRGAPDPVGAAQSFVLQGGVAGFGSPSSVWALADPGQVGRGEATLIDGTVSLHAVRLPNGTWAIDSGARCV